MMNTTINIIELFNKIDTIIFVNNAMQFDMRVIDADDEIDPELFDIDKINSMTIEQLNSITDVILLKKMHDIEPDLLTSHQLHILLDDLKTKVVVDKKSVQTILNDLKKCNRVWTAERPKNRKLNEDFFADEKEKLEIIHSLTINDYINSSRNVVKGYIGNDIIVFMKTVELITREDDVEKSELKDILIYIKIDLTQTLESGSTVAVVSFHESECGDEWHPYKNKSK